MKKNLLVITTIIFNCLFSQNNQSLEFTTGAGNPTGNGPVQSTTINFQKNTNNPTGNTFATHTPALSATFTLSNQQYTFSPSPGRGVSIGATASITSSNAASAAIMTRMNFISSPSNTHFTYAKGATPGTGITVGTNTGVQFWLSTTGLRINNEPLPTTGNSVRYYMSDMTINFSRPVNNPVVHITGMGGAIGSNTSFSAEMELSTPGYTLTRLSGSPEFSVPNTTQILNSAAVFTATTGSGGASGSVVVNGSNITSVTFKVYMKATAISGPTWGPSIAHYGDNFNIGVSALESDLSITKTVNQSSPIVGENVTFTLLASNNGISNDTNVTVNDLLPTGFTYVSSSTATGTYNPASGIWDIGNLDMGATASLTVNATVLPTGNYTNTAIISGDNEDPDLANNTASASAIPQLDSDNDGIPDNCDLDDDNDGILDISESICTLSGQTVRIGYIPDSRDLDSDNGHTFDGQLMSGSGRLKLLNSANFGSTGTVKANVVLVPINANPITKASINALNLDIIFLGGIDNTSFLGIITNTISSYLSDSEFAAIRDWSDDSLKNVVVSTQFQAVPWGASIGWGNVNPNTPTPLGAVSPIFNGPFGTVTSFNQGGGFQGYFNTNSICSQQPLAKDGLGRTTIYIDGNYNDIMLADIGILTTTGGVSSGGAITNNNDKLFANIWAFAINQSLCSGLDSDGDGIPNQLDLDSDNDGCVDALEGDENVSTAQLVTASGSVTVGTGSTASNQNLCADGTCVDANGVPTIVNSGGTADIGNDQGQGIGSSQNAAIHACPIPFTCDPKLFLSQYPTPGQAAMYSLNSNTNPLTITNLDSSAGGINNTGAFRYNAIGFNTLDSYIYGINSQSATSNHLIQIDATGRTTDMGPVAGLPTGSGVFYLAGDMDDAGNLYVLKQGGSTELYKINVAAKTATMVTLTQSLTTLDFAYNKVTGKFYGFNTPTNTLYSFTPTGTVNFIGTPGPYGAYGAMFSGSTGSLFGNANDGSGFYQFNITTGARTLISSSIVSDGNDGAHCVNSPITFSSILSVTKDDGKTQYIPGTTNTYTIVVKNSGPFGVQGVSVVDNVPVGIPVANVTYTAVASAGSTTNVVGTQTGNINDLVDLQVDGTVTYTVVLAVPSTYTGNLTNTVSVTPPVESTDQTVKTASDTDTVGACYNSPNTGTAGVDSKHGITLLQRAGAENGNWPMIRKSAHTVLESNTKGFVITRMASPETSVTNPQEGMMVYDTDDLCLKIYDGTAWSCFSTPACP